LNLIFYDDCPAVDFISYPALTVMNRCLPVVIPLQAEFTLLQVDIATGFSCNDLLQPGLAPLQAELRSLQSCNNPFHPCNGPWQAWNDSLFAWYNVNTSLFYRCSQLL